MVVVTVETLGSDISPSLRLQVSMSEGYNGGETRRYNTCTYKHRSPNV